MDYSIIWQQLADAENSEDTEVKTNLVDAYICQCGGKKCITDTVLTCTSCGVMDRQYIDDTPEWTSGAGDDGSVDPARCGLPTDFALYSESWGNSTIIKGKNWEQRRMAKINFHNSMSYKDRALHHAYVDMDDICKNSLGLNETIAHQVKCMYRSFNQQKLTRGAIRDGVKANCVMHICKTNNVPRTTKEVATAFNIPTKDISRTYDIFREHVQKPEDDCPKITKASDIIIRMMNDLNISDGYYRIVRTTTLKLAARLEKCVPLMGKNPQSIAAVIIMRSTQDIVNKSDIVRVCGVSIPTLTKINAIIEKFLT